MYDLSQAVFFLTADKMLRRILGVVLCATIASGATHHNPYCSIDPKHTMCQFQVSAIFFIFLLTYANFIDPFCCRMSRFGPVLLHAHWTTI